ncbi:MAG TPA: extracellular solute-binding protein, partial [Armatimonadota bacterium]|nr:extracellular solute-binding protein [Armatimonadota bacterium]
RPDLANTSIVEEDILVIPAEAKHPDEAFEFLKFVASEPGMELLCTGQGKNSPRVRTSPKFMAEHPNPYIRVFSDLAKSPNAVTTPAFSLWQEYSTEMTTAFDDIWLLRASPAAALQKVQARMQAKLDREIRQWQRRGKSYIPDEVR